MTQLILQPVGDGVAEVTIVRWLKRPGDPVLVGDAICEAETDKITVEVPATSSGMLGDILCPEGARARIGDAIAALAETAGGSLTETASQVLANGAPTPSPSAEAQGRARVSPVVARMAAENHIDLSMIQGTGDGGRVTKADVIAHLTTRGAPTESPAVAPRAEAPTVGKPGPADAYEVVPLSSMRARIAEHMAQSVATSPHVATVFEFDFAAVARHRDQLSAGFKSDGVHLTYLAYVALATAQALAVHRVVNSQWAGDSLKLMRDVNLGIAVALPGDRGLVVPVIHRANELSLKGIARRIQELAQRARSNGLTPADLAGGTFTITNHGAGGSLAGTPIINQPQAGILGFGAIEKRAVVLSDANGDAIAIRPRAYMSLSFDHRIFDGAAADAFMRDVKAAIEGWA